MKTFLFWLLSSFLFCGESNAQTENPKLVITPLTHNFFVYTTWQNYGGTPFPANGMYVITDAGAILIDCPWDSTQWQPLLDSIQQKHKKKVVLAIATHFHADRSEALAYYKKSGIPTWTSANTKQMSKQKNEPQAQYTFLRDTTFRIGAEMMEAYYPGGGHTADNIVLWFGSEKILYGGCLVKSTEAEDLGNLGDADLKAYPSTIQKLIKKYPDRKFVIPGHQSWSDGKALEHTVMLLSQHH